MKSSFKANLLKHFLSAKAAKKADEKGFTLIELLVVIIIIGILAAIALPAFLNQASKARQSEAKQALGALNRGQQAYRLENPNFSPTVAGLALGLDVDTNNYAYGPSTDWKTAIPTADVGKFATDAGAAGTAATLGNYAEIAAVAKDSNAVRAYQGSVATSADSEGNASTITILCESTKPMLQASAAGPDSDLTGASPQALQCSSGIPLN